MTIPRRDFLRNAAWAVLPLVASRQTPPAQQGQGRGAVVADTLAFSAGKPSTPLGPLDNDPGVIAIERKLRCACGCTLDVYTCRTTDFACTVSPRMHGIVVAKVQQRESAQQILDWFVAHVPQGDDDFGGTKVLMAPPASGFNLMGYLLPGLSIAAVGALLAAWLLRRRAVAVVPVSSVLAAPDSEQLARLRRALDEVDS